MRGAFTHESTLRVLISTLRFGVPFLEKKKSKRNETFQRDKSEKHKGKGWTINHISAPEPVMEKFKN